MKTPYDNGCGLTIKSINTIWKCSYGNLCPKCKKGQEGYLQGIADRNKDILEKSKKVIVSENCRCGHSKDSHGMHQLDKHGAECNQCPCKLYTWKSFVLLKDKIKQLDLSEVQNG